MTEDHGLFGPDSISWRVYTDPSMWVAAFTALAIQSLHPPTMWGTYQHSTLFVREHALRRLLRTADFVAVRTFGSLDEVERAGRRVCGIHSRLRGHDPETGAEFRVDEPVNLLWVHCGEIVAYLVVARRAGILITDAEADAFVDEQRRAAAVVGLDPATVPGSVAELDAYVERMLPELRLTDEALAAFRMWMNTPTAPGLEVLKAVYPVLAALGFALLPDWARRLYRLPPDNRVLHAATTASLRATRAAMYATPQRYRGTTEQMRRIATARALMRDRPRTATVAGP